MVSVRASRSIALVSLIAALGCKVRNPDAAGLLSEETVTEGEPQAPAGDGSLKVCAAVRGNGHYILTHFGALARITEHYGKIDALAGGSSSTVTMFMHESMAMNPLVESAQGRDKDLRMALLLKSILGYVEVMKNTPEATGITNLISVFQQAQAQGIFALSESQYKKAAEDLSALLKNPKLKDLVNPNVLNMLANTDNLGYLDASGKQNYPYKVNEVKASLQSIVGFKALDQKIFFREGIISFPGLARALNRMANFYAGYQPTNMAKMTDFVEGCAVEKLVGAPWPAVAAADAVNGKGKCGKLFEDVLVEYRKAVDDGKAPAKPSRLTETVGATVPSIVSTAVLKGANAVKKYEAARTNYRLDKTPNFDVDFNEVKFGYWIPQRLQEAVDAGMRAGGGEDGKLAKFENLGSNATWEEVLKASPAEPGLSPAVELKKGELVSVGGWSDLSPVQVLETAGCDKVVYVTRRQAESTFLTSPGPIDAPDHVRVGVAEQLNMQESQRKGIYELKTADGDKPSGFVNAIVGATERGGVWCTDWNEYGDAQPGEMYLHSYGIDGIPDAKGVARPGAVFFTKDPDLASSQNAFPNKGQGPIVGCTVP